MFVLGLVVIAICVVAIAHSCWESLTNGDALENIIEDNWNDLVLFGLIAIGGAGIMVADFFLF